jgi:MFS family permease
MTSPAPSAPAGRAPLGRSFWLAWSAGTVSTLGDGIRYVAFPLLAASLSRDPRAVTAVAAAGYLPWLLFGLIGGAVVDRVDRRRLMWQTDLLRTLAVAGFAALVAGQRAPIAVIAVTSFGLGTAETLFDNADSAILPMLVPAGSLERANALLLSAETVMSTLLGAPLGGLLFTLGPAFPPAADAVTFAVATVLILTIRGNYSARGDRAGTSVWLEIGDGLRWLWRQPLLRTLCLLLALLSLTFAAAEAVLVLYALEVLQAGTLGYSLLLVAFAAGGLIGSLLAPRLRRLIGLPALVIGTSLGQALGILVTGLTSSLAVALPALVFIGLCNLAWTVTAISARQTLAPAELLGRVTSSYRVIGFSSTPLGAVLGGLLAKAYGLHTPYLLGALLLAVATLVCAPSLREPADPVRSQ